MFPPQNAILQPRVDTLTLTKEEASMYSALIYHELRHHALSTKEVIEESLKDGQLVKDLTNGIEDARIETTKLYRVRGREQDLFQYRMKTLRELLEKNEFETLSNRWGWLIMTYVFALPGYGRLQVPLEMQKYWDLGWKILQDGRFEQSCKKSGKFAGKKGCSVSLELARDILKAWQEERSEEFEDEKKQQESGKGDGGSDGSSKNESSDREGDSGGDGNSDSDPANGDDNGSGSGSSGKGGKKGKSSKRKKGGGDSDDGSDSEKSDGDPEDDTGRNDKDPGKDDNEERGDDSGDLGSNEDGNGEDGGDDSSSEGSGDSDGEDEFPGADSTGDSDGEDKDSESEPELVNGRPKSIKDEYEGNQNDKETEIDFEELKKMVAQMGIECTEEEWKQIEASLFGKENWDDSTDPRDPMGKYHTEMRRFKGDPYIPYTAEDREIFPTERPELFDEISGTISTRVAHLQRQLTRLLMTKSMNLTERAQRNGRLDPYQFHKVIHGSRRVKKRVFPGIHIDTAVTLLLDLSGSMMGDKAELAVKIGMLFGEALKSIPQVSYEVIGYNSSPLQTACASSVSKDGYTRTEIVNHWKFKTFDENWRTVRHRLGSCAMAVNHSNPLEGGACGGCNCDHENVIWSAARLYSQPQPNKVMIVLCDGEPSGYNGTYGGKLEEGLREAVKRVRKSGIKLFCFGMMAERVREFYAPDVEILRSLEDLDEKALRKLAEFLLKGT